MSSVYIISAKQISAQQPLAGEWFERPVLYTEPYVRATDPDYKQFFTPNESRRFGKILKRALLVSRQAMAESGVASPDAIITGTGLGCIENTEIFLDKLVREGEEMLNPTHFMQSTHNTVGSLIAIDARCHAYNTTYAHGGISFECALQDAFMQLEAGEINTVLVGAHDEMTPAYFALLKKAGYLGRPGQAFAGETAVAMILSTTAAENPASETPEPPPPPGTSGSPERTAGQAKALCRIEAVEKFYRPGNISDALSGNLGRIGNLDGIEAVMTGISGDPKNDEIYLKNCAELFPGAALLRYKNIFGEGYTAPALGVYAAAECLHRGEIPAHLSPDGKGRKLPSRAKILCYNHFEGKNHTFILLSGC